ncbi:MAG: SpoIIE family protein phosphatase, partial [Bacilli bacterium]|nr:SpoIIE family protein phosphatase [Bacilli bacterium]
MALSIFIVIVCSLSVVGMVGVVLFLLPLIKPYNKLPQLYKDLIIGTLFLLLNIILMSFSIVGGEGEAQIRFSPCVVAPLVVSLMFNYPASLVTSIGSFFYRTFFNFTSVDLIRYSSAFSILIAMIIGMLLRHYIFHKKETGVRLNYVYGFFIGGIVETIRMFATIIANMDKVDLIYSSLAIMDIFSIFTAGISTALCVLLLMIHKKDSIRLRLRHDDRINSKVQKRTLGATFVCFIISLILTSSVANSQTRVNTLTSIVNTNDSITNQISTIKIRVVAQEDDYARIQTIVAKRTVQKTGYILIVTDQTITVGGIDYPKGSIFGTHNDKKDFFREPFKLDGDRTLWDDEDQNVVVTRNWHGESYAMAWSPAITEGEEVPGIIQRPFHVVSMIPIAEIDANFGVSVRVSVYLQIMIFSILYLIIIRFISRKVVKNITDINSTLIDISEGNLNAKVNATGSREFVTLSQNINLAVGSLKSYSNEISRRLEQETELAINIQKNSVMTNFPNEPNFEVYGSMRTAQEIGGDFYEYIKLSDDKVVFLLADVIGTGIAAAMYMVRAKTFLRTLLVLDEKTKSINLSSVVNRMNQEFANDNIMKSGMSMWIGLLDMKANTLQYINADHPAPLIALEDKVYRPLPCRSNVYIGIEKDYNYEVETITFTPGSEILLYTAGATQVRNKSGQMFGLEALTELVNSTKYFTMKQLVQNINDRLDEYNKGGVQVNEDLTFLSFAFTGLKDKKPEHEITLKAIPNNTPIAT